MAVGKELLVDPLPADVKKGVVWRETYWLTDEALIVVEEAADAAFAAPEGYAEIERRKYDDTEFVIL